MHHSSPKACTFSVSLQRRSPGTSVPTDTFRVWPSAILRPAVGFPNLPGGALLPRLLRQLWIPPARAGRDLASVPQRPWSLFLGVQFVTPRSVRVGRSRKLEAAVVACPFTTPHRRSSRSCGLAAFPP